MSEGPTRSVRGRAISCLVAGLGLVCGIGSDPRATESADREANETPGLGRGPGNSGHSDTDPADEAAESPARQTEEATNDTAAGSVTNATRVIADGWTRCRGKAAREPGWPDAATFRVSSTRHFALCVDAIEPGSYSGRRDGRAGQGTPATSIE